jgi:hypothetical protein
MKQQFWAWRCELERAGVNEEALTSTLFTSHFLRADLPCAAQCAISTSFFQANKGSENLPCAACTRSGAPRPMLSGEHETWFRSVSNNTRALFIGSGAWYNPGKLNETPEMQYTRTLRAVTPALKLLTERGVHVFWMDIPPPPGVGGKASFGWTSFAGMNRKAAVTLQASSPHVKFLNTSKATAERRSFSESLTSEGIHWCNPGRGTMPTFHTEHFMHVLVQAACTEPVSTEAPL